MAALGAAIISVLLPNHYRSEARILPVEARGGSSAMGTLMSAAAAFGINPSAGDSADSNFPDVISSQWLCEGLLDSEFEFRERRWRFGSEIIRKETLRTYLDAANTDRSVRAVRGIVNASRDLKSKILVVSAETRSPELSQKLVTRALQLLEQFTQERNRTRGGVKAAYAAARLSEAQVEAKDAEGALREFLEINRNYQTTADPFVRLKGANLEAELRLKQQLVVNLALSKEQALMEEKNDMPILNIMDPANLPIEKSGPNRTMFVVVAFLMVAVGYLMWRIRIWLISLLRLD
jgi:hypothetical protein